VNRVGSDPPIRWAFGPTVPILAGLAVLTALASPLPTVVGVSVAAAGVALGVALRGVRSRDVRSTFPLPVMVALGFVALSAGTGPLELLLVGVSGAAFVAWLADDPYRPPSGAGRGTVVWLVPTLGVVMAWASSLLLPRSTASLGVAGGLAAGALAVLAYLLSRPDLFDRDAAATI
jgi:hypothetical protein